MIREETIKILRKKIVRAHPCDAPAYEMAIRSLEAWGKVIDDIDKALSEEKDIGIRIGYTIAEKIIKNRLQEVEK